MLTKTSALGMDFGNSNSKMTLASHTGRTVEIHRVLFHGSRDDPERPEYPSEFVAMADLSGDGNQLICGRQALLCDDTIPLKSILTYAVGIRRYSVLERLPGGTSLIRAVARGLTIDVMRDALRQHFELLRVSVLQQAETSRYAPFIGVSPERSTHQF